MGISYITSSYSGEFLQNVKIESFHPSASLNTIVGSITAPLPAGTNAIGVITVSNFPVTQPVSGAVSVSNFPATQPISGTVAVSTLPAIPTGTNSIGSISNIPVNIDTAALVTLTSAVTGSNSVDLTNLNGRGIQLGINVTAITGTLPIFTVSVQGKDVASGQYYTVLQSAALIVAGFTLLTIYPGAPTTANIALSQILPRTFRIAYTIAGTTPAVTATIGASIIV